MEIVDLLEEFDLGIQKALEEYYSLPESNRILGYSQTFADFSFYDTKAVDEEDLTKRSDLFVRLSNKRKLSREQPILWKYIHSPLAKILHSELKYYAGFATLFSVNHEAGSISTNSDIPRYPSMVIDDTLKAPGLRDALLTTKQFPREKKSPIPLTAVCLNPSDDSNFETLPIIFHWIKNSDEHDCFYSEIKSNAKYLNSWAHIIFSPNEKLKFNQVTGIDIGIIENWDRDDYCKIDIYDSQGRLTKEELLRRLKNYENNKIHDTKILINKLAWTVNYFVYASNCYLEENDSKYFKSVQDEPGFDHLSIVCAPATFHNVVSSALYVPIMYDGPLLLDQSARSVLSLARILGSPLERIKELFRGSQIAQTSFAHQTSSTIDSIAESINRLPNNIKQEIGPSIIARLHILACTINSYRSKNFRKASDYGLFPYNWTDSENVLDVYRDCGIIIGLTRASNSEEKDVRIFADVAIDNIQNPRTYNSCVNYFEKFPLIDREVIQYLQHTHFAVLFILALKQAFYHTIRSHKIDKSNAKIIVQYVPNFNKKECAFIISNPSVSIDLKGVRSKDEVELDRLAKSLSDLSDHPILYYTEGPHELNNIWETKVIINWRKKE